jgi:hypothetical protein
MPPPAPRQAAQSLPVRQSAPPSASTASRKPEPPTAKAAPPPAKAPKGAGRKRRPFVKKTLALPPKVLDAKVEKAALPAGLFGKAAKR